jgi:hypothetical protein
VAKPAEVSEAFDRSEEYALRRVPDLLTVGQGAEVHYTCAHRSGRPPPAIGGNSSYRDGVRWYKFSARALLEETRGRDPGWAVPLEKGPVGEFAWGCRWDDPPGRYVIGSELSDARASTFCFLPQYVEEAGRVAADGLHELLASGRGPSPDEAEQRIARHLANLKAIERRFPPGDIEEREAHEEAVRAWKRHHMALRGLLGPTEGKARLPVAAVHLETRTQQRRPLMLFLCHAGDDVVGRSGRKRPRWVLVDWTDPTDARFHGTYEGGGDSDGEAIDEALDAWDRGNRYPAGLVSFQLPAPAAAPGHHQRTTDGKSLGDEVRGIFDWIAIGGLLVAGALVLFAPVPVLVSGALGTSLLSSTAAAGISIGQRWRAGVFDWRQDAFDGLTIVSALFTAGGAWVRGARVLLGDQGGRTVTRVFIGARLGADLVQGVLVAEEALAEWDQLTTQPGLLPEERARRLLALVRNLAATGLLTYVSLRGAAGELANLEARPRHVASEGEARPSGEKLAALTNPGATIDTTRPPVVEGHPLAAEGRQRTTVSTRPVAVRPLGPEETAFAKFYRGKDHPWREVEVTRDYLFLFDKDGFSFEASCKRGTLSITILTNVGPDSPAYLRRRFGNPRARKFSDVLWAKELYPLMYDHFESVGNRVKKLKGPWAWDNYRDAKQAYDRLLATHTPKEAAKLAVLEARTWKKYHRDQGLTKVLWAELVEDAELFDFEIGRPGR